jgi:selenocysteine lyase/cysteine desulfurase
VPQGDAPIVPLEAFDTAIDEDTALVAVTQVCYRNGACIDLEGVIKLAHERGALVLVDAYQAIGTMPIDVHALGVDLLVAGALKYLLASAGLGFLYCRRELVEQLRPTATGWFADADVFAMDIQDYSPAADARRFQAGTPPIPSIYAGIAGIELMKEIGIEATRAHVSQLNEVLIAGIDELAGIVVTPRDPARRGALVAIRSTDEHALVGALAADGILTSSRDGNLRVSAHAYNTHEDIEALLGALKRHRALLAA